MWSDTQYLRLALALARRGYGATSPNPMVGAVLVKRGEVIGRGWHHRAGQPHAEIEALNDARKRRCNPNGAALFVTLEPCCTRGRTPPCTDAIIAAGIRRVIVGATDPNPCHCGKGFSVLRRAGIDVKSGVLQNKCELLNEAFNHWIVHGRPLVTVKAAMTLDGKIATASGESKWITGDRARAFGMKLRQGSDAILAGINTILADDPSLTYRGREEKGIRRIILDSRARTPLSARVVSDDYSSLTTIFVGRVAPVKRVSALSKKVSVVVAPGRNGKLNLPWILRRLGKENVTSLLVEGGGEVNGSFLMQGLAHRVAFFYAPKILGGRDSRRAVAGEGARNLHETLALMDLEWRQLASDWLLTARVAPM
jgi:diaminohydroxyphosphoribosylaminopyrimidine deaminase / 5-amino-6-(5-phosphoribosylamino)uracil reductase